MPGRKSLMKPVPAACFMGGGNGGEGVPFLFALAGISHPKAFHEIS